MQTFRKRETLLPVAVFGFFTVLFMLVCTRLQLKTDDGNFLGMLLNPGFSYAEFLKYRYHFVSGRTVNEFLTMFFFGRHIVWWQLANSAALIYIVFFLARLIAYVPAGITNANRAVFASMSVYFIFCLSLNSNAFWFSGSFPYLWTMSAMLFTLSPSVFSLLGVKIRLIRLPFTLLGAVIASSQEQSCALAVTFQVILSAALLAKQKRRGLVSAVSLVPMLVNVWSILNSPGAAERMRFEEAANYPGFSQLSVFTKLAGGFVNLVSHQVFFAHMLSVILLVFLSAAVYNRYKKRWLAYPLIAVNIIGVCLSFPFNLLYVLQSKSSFYSLNTFFTRGAFDAAATAVLVLSSAVVLACAVLSAALLRKKDFFSTAVFLCVMAAYAGAMIISFSPTIYASGQRVFFFTDILLLAACCILYPCVASAKTVIWLRNAAYGYAVCNYGLNVIVFAVAELP